MVSRRRRLLVLALLLLVPWAAAAHPVAPPALEVGTNFFFWGMEHLWGGWDHLSFLAGLLLPGGGLGRLVKVATGFTASHSLTLGLVATGTVYVESWWVEPAIAASIAFVALEGARTYPPLRRRPDHRFEYAVGFGLVHGMGFAGALDELGMPAGRVVPALFGFNLGLETAQLVVILAALPLLVWLAGRPERLRRRLVRGGSFLLAALGLWWCLERVYYHLL